MEERVVETVVEESQRVLMTNMTASVTRKRFGNIKMYRTGTSNSQNIAVEKFTILVKT